MTADAGATVLRRCLAQWKNHADDVWHTCRWMHHFTTDFPHQCAWCGDEAGWPAFCTGPKEGEER